MYTEEISSFPAVYSGNGVGNIRIYGTAAGLRSIEMIVYNPNYTDYIKDRYDINTDFIYGWDGDVLKFKSNSSRAWDNATVGRAELDSSHWYFQHFENAAVYGRMSYANARYPSNFYNDIYLKGIYWDNIRTQIIAANGGRCFKPENSGSWYLAWSGDMSQERRREWNSPCRLLRDDDFQYCYIGYDGPLYENDYIDLTNRVRVNSDGTQAAIKFHFGTSDISLYNGTAIIDFTMTNSLPASGMITKPSKVVISGVAPSEGAFMDAALLAKVRIPSSVKRIGELAFSGTQLTSVKIARDCEFSESSFPEGCEVTYYTSDGSYSGDYGQLLDCDGKIVLDKSAARVYVKVKE